MSSISNSLHGSTKVNLRQVHYAIMLNDPVILEFALKSVDPTKDLPGVYYTKVVVDDDLKNTFGSNYNGGMTFVSYLHIAVYNCDRVARICGHGHIELSKALNVLNILIAYHLKHADVPNWSKPYHLSNVYTCNSSAGKMWLNQGESPLFFSLVLKSHCKPGSGPSILSTCIDKLLKYETDLNAILTKPKGPIIVGIPMKSIPESVYNIWQSLLFSEKYADVIFDH